MANQKEIGEIVKKCKILLLDIEGTTTSISFVKDKLFPYAEENVKNFLDTQWETDDVKEAVAALRKQALEDQEKSVEGLVKIPGEDASKEDQIEGLAGNVKWQMSSDRKAGALKTLQGLVWKQGYEKGEIKGHVYDDVTPALEQWRSTEGRKVYIYSSGSVQAQKLLFGQSVAGDLLKHIDGHYDTAVGGKQEAASYKKIVEDIGCQAEDVLFLTDIAKEAEAASESGLSAALVSRPGNAPLPPSAASAFPVLASFASLAATNKRKTDDQSEPPAKIPKTDTASDDASAKPEKTETEAMETDIDTKSSEENVTKPTEETKAEEMEAVEAKAETDTDTGLDIAADATPLATAPIITEEIEATNDELVKDKMETEKEESKPVTNGNSEKTADPTPVVEIEDLTGKQSLDEVAEIIEDLEPVVEEPPSVEAEMAELQNVGEVLEKECDEILSKVQDVTNLDNITVKPLLNPISEEMETENVDSNDIVDRILDTELEMEMKQCDNLPEETVTDKSAEATTNNVTEPVKPTEASDSVTENEKPDQKVEVEANGGNGTVEDKTEETKVETQDEHSKAEDAPKETAQETLSIPEVQVNGKAINGNGDAVNGDAKDELSERLTENGKEVNGTNGSAEEGQGDGKPEIKAKAVAAAEPIEPIEQPVEA